jgi:hypothetical protein
MSTTSSAREKGKDVQA